jgi:glycosyltransferase involved in cell wall biosynthesis
MLGGHTVSAFAITYNEEDNIRGCLECLRWVDEIVVVDSFSEDRSVAIAREFTDRVIQQKFLGYTAQTRFACQQTTGDWVVWLDADERLSERAVEQIKAELQRPEGPRAEGFSLPRKTYFLDRWITHSGWYPQHKVRVFRRDLGQIAGSSAHPTAVVDGRVKKLKGDILHHSYPGGVMEMVHRSARFADMLADERWRAGRRCSMGDLLIKPPLEFFKKYFLRLGVLDGMPGFIIAVASAYYRFVRAAKMWELAHGVPLEEKTAE